MSQNYSEFVSDYGLDPKLWGPWASFGDSDRHQGWKLHISSIPQEAERLLETIVPLLIEEEVTFKVARDRQTLSLLNEGRLGSTQVGKFMTIYPDTDIDSRRLAMALIELTNGFRGPVIVTDLQLGDVVFTRYGSFNATMARDRLGLTDTYIHDPIDGELRPDVYKVPFKPPKNVENPFSEYYTEEGDEKRDRLFGPGYLLVDVLKAHARGSVFLALDLTQKKPRYVVLKEGRKHCLSDEYGRDMRTRLRRQHAIHRDLIPSVPVPKSYSYFEVKGNGYLALEFIDGDDLKDISTYTHTSTPLTKSYMARSVEERRSLLEYILATVDALIDLHAEGHVHRDLNPNNMKITADGGICLMDLELAHHVNDDSPSFDQGTPGFVSPQQKADEPPSFSDDIFSLGSILVALLSGLDPRFILFNQESDRERQLKAITDAPSSLITMTTQCLSAESAKRPSLSTIRSVVKQELDRLESHLSSHSQHAVSNTLSDLQLSRDFFERTAIGLLNDVPLNKENQLWYSIRSDSHLSRSVEEPNYTHYRSANRGIAGILYLLARLANEGISVEGLEQRTNAAVDWLLAHHPTIDDQLPGLHFGEAGVAVAICEAVRAELIAPGPWLDDYLNEALTGPLDWPDLTHGAAGQAIAALTCADLLGRPEFGDHAERCTEYLLETQDPDGGWTLPVGSPSVSGDRYTGFAHGAAGIIYALIEYDQRYPDTRVKEAYRAGARWLSDLTQATEYGASWPLSESDDDTWTWWCHGASGIALTFLRLFEVEERTEYAHLAEQALSSLPYDVRSPNLSQCHGLSGIGEVYLEAARVLANPEWAERAMHTGALLYNLGRNSESGGLIWPVENPDHPTGDLMVGSAGIAHFLLRLSSEGSGLTYPFLPSPAVASRLSLPTTT